MKKAELLVHNENNNTFGSIRSNTRIGIDLGLVVVEIVVVVNFAVIDRQMAKQKPKQNMASNAIGIWSVGCVLNRTSWITCDIGRIINGCVLCKMESRIQWKWPAIANSLTLKLDSVTLRMWKATPSHVPTHICSAQIYRTEDWWRWSWPFQTPELEHCCALERHVEVFICIDKQSFWSWWHFKLQLSRESH